MPDIKLTPRILANTAADIRDYYKGLGWRASDCGIGFDSQASTVKMACNNGAIDYTWDEAGHIRREHNGAPSKLIEFVDIDIARYVAAHNQQVKDSRLLARV